MKITIISKSVLAFIFVLSLSSFTFDKKENKTKNSSSGIVTFDAGLYQLSNTNKVKLAVDKGDESTLRILLKDNSGKIYYNEAYSNDEVQYRKVFDMSEMSDGKYYFELLYKDRKLTKEIRMETSKGRTILFQ